MFDMNGFKNQTVMVCGYLIADIYEYGSIKRISREAPIPVIEFESERLLLGGAGNVVANLKSLQGQVSLVSVVGQDSVGDEALRLLSKMKVEISGVLREETTFTTTKRRVLAQGEHTIRQQIVRLDRLPDKQLDESSLTRLWDHCIQQLSKVKAVIISDYHLPLIPLTFFKNLAQLAREKDKLVVVDSRHRLLDFKGVSLITPNCAEAEEAIGEKINNESQLKKAGQILLERTETKLLLITLGDEGMALFEPGKKMQTIPAYNRQEVFDVSGAGDTVVSAITLGLLSGMAPLTAAKLANITAGLVVRKLGTATVSLEELTTELENKRLCF